MLVSHPFIMWRSGGGVWVEGAAGSHQVHTRYVFFFSPRWIVWLSVHGHVFLTVCPIRITHRSQTRRERTKNMLEQILLWLLLSKTLHVDRKQQLNQQQVCGGR